MAKNHTIEIAYTRGDHSTVPGGVILRYLDGNYVAHHFSREPGSTQPIAFFWGHYCSTMQKGRQAYRSKLDRVSHELTTLDEIAKENVAE